VEAAAEPPSRTRGHAELATGLPAAAFGPAIS